MPCDDSSTDECRCGPGEACGVCFETRCTKEIPCPQHPDGCPKAGLFEKYEPSPSERLSLSTPCNCGHVLNWHMAGSKERDCTVTACTCARFQTSEPPMTPEEEEALAPACGYCKQWGHSIEDCPEACDHQCQCEHDHWDHNSSGYCKQCDCGSSTGHYPNECPEAPEDEAEALWDELHRRDTEADQAELPPQPDRRPPYAVAYSVQGHMYEVAVSGDATVRTVDGALVITHGLAPVAGIIQTRPMEGS